MAQISLAGARVSAGYTQETLAKELGVTRNTIINWETGKKKMKTVNLYAFCMATGFDPKDIFLPSEFTNSESEVN